MFIEMGIQDRIINQEYLIRKAQQFQMKVDESNRLKRYSDTAVTEFPTNSFVLVGYPDSGYGCNKPNRFTPNWQGPMRVISHQESEYTLLIINNEMSYEITKTFCI